VTQRFRLQDFGPPAPLPAVLAYLSRQGWRTCQEGPVIRCEGPPDDEGRPVVLFLPAAEAYVDYPLRLEDLIGVLAVIEERPAVEIIREMAEPLPAIAGAGGSLAEAILDEFQRSAPGVFSHAEVQRLAEQMTPALMNVEMDAEGLNVHMRAALLVARLAQSLPDDVGSQRLFGGLCARLLRQIGVPESQLPPDCGGLFRLSRTANPAAPDEVLVWLQDRLPPIAIASKREHRRASPGRFRPQRGTEG
jgi:hypothetical protein